MELLLFFLLGGIISVMSGFFGIGGGFLLTPILMLIGYSPLEAITTSLLFTIGTSLSGITAHIRLKNVLWKEGLILGLSGMAATQLARPFVLFLGSKGWDEWAIPLFYMILLSYFAITMLRQGKGRHEERASIVSTSIIKMILIGLFAGMVSTTLGVGGGFIMVPLSIAFLGIQPKKAVGTSLFAILLIVSVGFLSYAFTISIDYRIGLLLVAGGLIGSQFGARLTGLYENKEISFLLSGLYIATLLSVGLKLAGLSFVGLFLLAAFIVLFFTRTFIKIKAGKIQSTGS
ncbi:sulfite exporter TauE/SafE family protein [Bacillus sp. FJAT-29790]|uniref:sulfite exporter TauE/SafE family protein n=1 Tax=Bacillus sp. FJAT-29790 TaxID=1895002 RepID=UPI001C23762B|nr:sulfite exporter TauE/SafE family protein [Bacillus sp. FJAT-29790]MBU8879919.1 sulfite exporter TauE/SafE family protein [Bacillus sp. FJAT-29790]